MNINRPEWICTLCGFILKENNITLAANALTRMPQLADDVVCPDCCAPSNLFTLSLCVAWYESRHGGRVETRVKTQSRPLQIPLAFQKRKIGCYG
jgi:Rubredoxin.